MLPCDIDNLPVGLISINDQAYVLACNKQALQLFEISKTQILQQNIWNVLPELSSTIYRAVTSTIKTRKPQNIHCHYSKLNKWFDVNIQSTESGTNIFFIDRTLQHITEVDLKLYQSVIQNSADAVVITDKRGEILQFNTSSEQLFGYSEKEIRGKNISLLMRKSEADSHSQYMHRYLRSGVSGILGVGPRELIAQRKDGSYVEIELAISEFHSDDKFYFVGNMRDITIRKDLQRKLEQLAGHDALTGLANRFLLTDRASQAISFSSRNKLKLALLYIDLDGFKQINDSHGHAIGDQVIKTMADRMVKSVRACDTIARIGGDEFAILLTSISKQENGVMVANSLLRELNAEVEIQNLPLKISGSIGIAFYPDDATDFEVLLNIADKAMYQAKNQGKNRVHVWSESTGEAPPLNLD